MNMISRILIVSMLMCTSFITLASDSYIQDLEEQISSKKEELQILEKTLMDAKRQSLASKYIAKKADEEP